MLRGILTAFFTTALASGLTPQLEENWRQCTGSNVDAAISGCTAIIDVGGEAGANLGIAFYDRGLAYRHKDDVDRAIADFDQAIRLNPGDSDAFYNRANAYYRKSQIDRAFRPKADSATSTSAASGDPDGQLDRAIEDYGQAIRLRPDFVQAFNNRGIAYYDKRQFERAVLDYDQAIRLKPELAEAFNNRSLAYLKLNQYDRATRDFDQTIRLNQNYGNALVTVGLGDAKARSSPHDHRPM